MVNFYLMKILNDDMTLQQVPALWRKKVEAALP